jgi:hypothetical protein
MKINYKKTITDICIAGNNLDKKIKDDYNEGILFKKNIGSVGYSKTHFPTLCKDTRDRLKSKISEYLHPFGTIVGKGSIKVTNENERIQAYSAIRTRLKEMDFTFQIGLGTHFSGPENLEVDVVLNGSRVGYTIYDNKRRSEKPIYGIALKDTLTTLTQNLEVEQGLSRKSPIYVAKNAIVQKLSKLNPGNINLIPDAQALNNNCDIGLAEGPKFRKYVSGPIDMVDAVFSRCEGSNSGKEIILEEVVEEASEKKEVVSTPETHPGRQPNQVSRDQRITYVTPVNGANPTQRMNEIGRSMRHRPRA